jgi:hypothetical protein
LADDRSATRRNVAFSISVSDVGGVVEDPAVVVVIEASDTPRDEQ